MSSLNAKLAAVLNAVDRPGDFFTAGKADLLLPRLEVDGVGPVALPLLPAQAEQLVMVADRAPYGRGEATIVDTAVRRTWQIAADRVRITGKHWQRTLTSIIERVTEGLGASAPVAAELYKLLIYDRGSFFVSHRDTEKAPGMFATLVIALPSESAGGELIVRHKDRETRLDLRSEEPSEVAFVAFYADCVHEVLPVTDGCRLVLVYSLLRHGQGKPLKPPSYDREQAAVLGILEAWGTEGLPPEKLVYPLEHSYTQAELRFDALKGADAAAARMLGAAADRADCDLHLALLSIEESGTAEYAGVSHAERGRWHEPDDDDFDMGEIIDRDVSLSEWRHREGSRRVAVPLSLPVDDDELVPPDALHDMDPDEQHFHEATGNEGATIERSYRRAALVLWPRRRFLAVLNQAGSHVTLPYLDDLVRRWAACDDERQALWQQAHELSGHVLAGWINWRWYPRDAKQPTELARLLSALTELEDKTRIEQVVCHIAARGGLDVQDTEAVVDALRLFPNAERERFIESIVAETAASSLDACSALLASLLRNDDLASQLLGSARRLVEALPGAPADVTAPHRPPRRAEVTPGCITDAVASLIQIDEALTVRMVDHLLAWPKTYDIDRVLVPALRMLKANVVNGSMAAQRLRSACLAHLQARISVKLEPPQDWSRVGDLACPCRHCTDLGRFLVNRERKLWLLKAAEHDRHHVEHGIRRAQCDLDVKTDRRGRPYTLVCTKNQASYERSMVQRQKDLDSVTRLTA